MEDVVLVAMVTRRLLLEESDQVGKTLACTLCVCVCVSEEIMGDI